MKSIGILLINTLIASTIIIILIIIFEFSIRLAQPELNVDFHIKFSENNKYGLPLGEFDTQQKQINNFGDYNITVNFNKMGFREDKDYLNASEKDWLVIGDSYVFGWGVEAELKYTSFLDKKISYNTYNAAAPADALHYLRISRLMTEINPSFKKALLHLTLSNDIIDYNLEEIHKKESFNENDYEKEISFPNKVFFLENSSIYFLLTTVIKNITPIKVFFEWVGLIEPQINQSVGRNIPLKNIEKTIKVLENISDEFDDLIIVINPEKIHYFGPASQETIDEHISIIKMIEKAGFNVVNPLSEFGSILKHQNLFFINDPHWSIIGNQKMADIVYNSVSFDD